MFKRCILFNKQLFKHLLFPKANRHIYNNKDKFEICLIKETLFKKK